MHIWIGSTPYGLKIGRYYGFNLFNVLSIHFRQSGMGNEIALSVGKWLRFFPV